MIITICLQTIIPANGNNDAIKIYNLLFKIKILHYLGNRRRKKRKVEGEQTTQPNKQPRRKKRS